ncbi:uncharacterized protein O3C94_001351 [Discoglossus pictus]
MSQLCLLPMLLCCFLTLTVSATLVRPWNITLSSENFQHVLTWEDKNNESSVRYSVQYMEINRHGPRPVRECSNITVQYCDLTDYFTDLHGTYCAAVQSFSDNQASTWSWTSVLVPLEQTLLGPPIVDVVPCERSVNVTIRPPVSHLKSKDGKSTICMLSENVYPIMSYTIQLLQPDVKPWRTAKLTMDAFTETFTTTIPDLLPNTNYCISASASANLNSHQIPSAYRCVITRGGGDSTPAYIAGAVFGGLVLLIGLVLFLIALDRSGYLCMKRKFFPKVLKSLPKSYSVYEENKQSVCPAYVVPVEIIHKPEKEQSDDSDEESCAQAYAQRKKLDIVESDRSAGDSNAGLSSTASSLMGSIGQDYAQRKSLKCNLRSDSILDDSSGPLSSAASCASATEAPSKEHPPILDNESCVSDTPLCSSNFTATSNLPFNSSETFNINLNSVLVGNSEDLWTGFKKVVPPQKNHETSVDLHDPIGALSEHELTHFTSVDVTGISVSEEFSCEEDFNSEASDGSDSDDHFVSGYMRR